MNWGDTDDPISIPGDVETKGDFESNNPIGFYQAIDQAGVTVVDLVERNRYTLSTSPENDPKRAEPDDLLFPVDVALSVQTDHVKIPDVPALFVRDDDGGILTTTDPPMEQTFPDGQYYLEICAPIKLYLRVDGPLTVTATFDEKRIEFDRERSVIVGARSKHEHPAATVTTTSEPTDVMEAISTFGSALKTTSPERSFPTLRGHPPTVELGDALSIPDGLEPPETGVTIEVPPDYRHVYPVSSLSYYLGARVVPGRRPRIITDAGFVHDLDQNGEFEREVERILKSTFLLDCVTRPEGLYAVDLDERTTVKSEIDLDFEGLYDRPLAERLESYLSVPYGALGPHVPDWTLTTHVTANAESVEALPFVVNDLAVIKTGHPQVISPPSPVDEQEMSSQEEAIEQFVRSTESTTVAPDSFTVDVTAMDSMEHTWIGDGAPRGTSKATTVAYKNRLKRSPVDDDIGVTVVCNDSAMVDEHDVVHRVYDSREASPVDVTVHEQLETDELRAALGTDTEFLHYIGHIDERGFECADGYLDASTLESTGVDAFLLNACTSYDQGMALIEAGAVGGIVTLAKVVNRSAVSIGSTVSRLLNNGYPLRPALDIARTTSYIGDDYIVVGDGSLAVAQGSVPAPHLHRVEQDGTGFSLEIISYSSVTGGIGSMFVPYIGDDDKYYLNSGYIDSFCLGEEEMREFLQLDDIPIEFNGDLYWPDEFDAVDL